MSDFGFRVDCERRKFWRLAHGPNSKVRCAGLFIAITMASTVGCDKVTSVQGVVFDNDQKPMPSAVVSLVRLATGRAAEDTTNRNGSFFVTIIHGSFAGRFKITVSKPGYATYRQDVEANTRQKLKVVLAKADHAKPIGR